MAPVSAEHFAVFNRLLLSLHAEPRPEAVPGLIVAGIQDLVAAPYIVYRVVAATDGLGRVVASAANRWDKLAPEFEKHRQDDWLVNRRRQAPCEAALAISDHLEREAWRAHSFYQNFCSRHGIEDQMSIECPHGADGILHLVISRDAFGAFHPVDRWVLDSIRPHLLHICNREPVEKTSLTAVKLLEGVLGEGIVIFDEATGTVTCTDNILTMIEATLVPTGKAVADVLGKWIGKLLDQSRKTNPGMRPGLPRTSVEISGLRLTLLPGAEGSHRVISIRAAQDDRRLARFREFGLTQREAEVLLWMAQGKSNKEIESILGLSGSTVKTHLRSIFNCLGVETRTAAAVAAWEVQGFLW